MFVHYIESQQKWGETVQVACRENLKDFLEREIKETFSQGLLERTAEKIEKSVDILAKLISTLANKGLLTIEEVQDLLPIDCKTVLAINNDEDWKPPPEHHL